MTLKKGGELSLKNGERTPIAARIPVEEKLMIDNIARRFGTEPSEVIRTFISDGIKKTNSDMIIKNSKMDQLIEELKDFFSMSQSKSNNRMASLLSNILITSYENKGTLDELLKLIIGQLYQEEHVEGMLDEIYKKVNTAAIVKIKSRKEKELVKFNG